MSRGEWRYFQILSIIFSVSFQKGFSMLRLLFALFLLILCFSVLAWDLTPAHAQGTGTIQGRVTNSTTGSGFSGVTVTAGGIHATTNSTGYYTLLGVAAGSQTVSVTSLSTYHFGSVTVTVVAGGTVTAGDIVGSPDPIGKPPHASVRKSGHKKSKKMEMAEE